MEPEAPDTPGPKARAEIRRALWANGLRHPRYFQAMVRLLTPSTTSEDIATEITILPPAMQERFRFLPPDPDLSDIMFSLGPPPRALAYWNAQKVPPKRGST